MYRPSKKPPRIHHRCKRRRPPRTRSRASGIQFRPQASGQLKPLLEQIGVPEVLPFVPDPFQQEGVATLEQGDVLVTAPTGAGKTWIAVRAMEQLLGKGQRSWYASPLKALSNAKYVEFSEHFGKENVGILTGDRKENTKAPIVVGTTEILRNQLYDAMHTGEDLQVDLVVLDEAHYLGDEDRGVVWEEVMIYLPARVRLLLLSATVSNAAQIAGWLKWLRGVHCHVVATQERPVPLHPLFMFPTGEVTPFIKRLAMAGKVRQFLERHPKSGLTPRRGVANFSQIIGALRHLNLLPAIFFLKSRVDCNHALQAALPRMAENEGDEQSLRFHHRLRQLLQIHPHLKTHRQLKFLRTGRVGAHHGGQLPTWKLLVETIMKEGELDAIFSTSTVAAGVNFPARTVVISQSDRFNGREFVPLTATDLLQMTGRAGRRGMDKVGFVVLLPGPYQDAGLIFNLLHAQPEPINSQMQISFSMVLNLLLSHRPEEIREILSGSFATYQGLDEDHDLVGQSQQLERELAAELEATACGSLDMVLSTISRKRELQRQLEEARRDLRRGWEHLAKLAYLTPGRIFRSRKGKLYMALRQGRQNEVDGVTAVQLKPMSRLRRGRLRTTWLRLEKISTLIEFSLDLPDDNRPDLWLQSAASAPLDTSPPLKIEGPLPSPQQEAWETLELRRTALENELAAFGCGRCPHLRQCEPKKQSGFRDRINRALDLRQRLHSVTNRLWYEFSRYYQFLQEEGYVDLAGKLTADGAWTAQLRLDQPLLIAEGIRQGLFPHNDPALLASLIAPFVSDREQHGEPLEPLGQPFPTLGQAFSRMLAALRPLQMRLRQQGFPTSPLPFLPAAAAYSWSSGASWEEVLQMSSLDEGDLAMLIYRTADNLRQLEGLAQSHPYLASCADRAIESLLREPVVVPI
jgi:ATP-dependent RNA helicase HelY